VSNITKVIDFVAKTTIKTIVACTIAVLVVPFIVIEAIVITIKIAQIIL
jgi:hypothetical protein